MNDMMREEENREEVDDSGFYAGETPLISQSVPVKK